MVVNLCTLPPPGHMLRCSGLHLHGDEFVVYHHWLGVWRVQKRRWTLKKKKPPETLQTEHQPKILHPPVIKPPLICRKRGMCREPAKAWKRRGGGEHRSQCVLMEANLCCASEQRWAEAESRNEQEQRDSSSHPVFRAWPCRRLWNSSVTTNLTSVPSPYQKAAAVFPGINHTEKTLRQH